MRWDLVVPAVVALVAAAGCLRAAARGSSRRSRTAWYSQGAACALWLLAPAGWLAGLAPLADAGRVAFLALTAVRCWLACPGPSGRARMLLGGGITAAIGVAAAWSPVASAVRGAPVGMAVPLAGLALSVFAGFVALRAGERGMPGWLCAGLFAIAMADLDAGRGGGSAGLGWLLGFGCLTMAAYVYRGQVPRHVLAGLDDQMRLVDDLRDLPGPGPSPYGNARGPDLLGATGGALFESKRAGPR